MLKYSFWLLPVIAAFCAWLLLADLRGFDTSSRSEVARLSESTATVKRLRKGELSWDRVQAGASFAEGDTVMVGETGTATLVKSSGDAVVLQAGSMVVLNSSGGAISDSKTLLDLRSKIAVGNKTVVIANPTPTPTPLPTPVIAAVPAAAPIAPPPKAKPEAAANAVAIKVPKPAPQSAPQRAPAQNAANKTKPRPKPSKPVLFAPRAVKKDEPEKK